MLRRRWVTVTAMFLLALFVSASISLSTAKQYESHAKIFVSADTKNLTDAYAVSVFIPGRVKSYANLATHREVLERVATDLDSDVPPGDLVEHITAVVEPDTVIIIVTAREATPDSARTLARAVSENLVEYLIEVETPGGQGQSQIKPTISDPAILDVSPVSPRTGLNLAVAGLIGLLLGIGLATVRDLLDNTVKTAEDIEELTKAPVMASVSHDKSVAKHPLLTDVKGFSPRGEAFRMLRTNLQYLSLIHI